jgi:predicted lipoprotein with Yx(FWY)xxD motif
MIRPTVLAVGLTAVLCAGCGSDTAESPAVAAGAEADISTSESTTVTRSTPGKRGKTIKVIRSQFGRILADGRGQAVYVFDKETSSRPQCYGGCARAWPPVLTNGKPVAGKGVRGRRLGTTKRRSGKRQVTVNGRPLYYYVDDAPGRVLCHNVEEFGGLWLVVRPSGTPAS